MNILITGHKGFIGTALTDALRDDHVLSGLDIHRPTPNQVTDHQCITRAELPSNIDMVIHLAGIGGVRESMNRPADYWKTNVIGTQRILEHYKNIRCLVASSSTAYEPALNPYAGSKYVAESIPHKNVVFMRFHTVYSITPRKGMLFDKLINNELTYTTNHRRDFIHVNDICSAIKKLIKHQHIKGVVDIGTGTNISIQDIRPDLPCHTIEQYPEMAYERHTTLADISIMKSIGWRPTIRVEDFMRENRLKPVLAETNG